MGGREYLPRRLEKESRTAMRANLGMGIVESFVCLFLVWETGKNWRMMGLPTSLLCKSAISLISREACI
jgi:hypothetical protein